jgi:hypothetical protein
MKTLLIIFLCAFAMSGCMTYQYVTLDSTLPKTPDGEFQIDNDTVLVTFQYMGYNCPARIKVYNKLDVPLYVDWQRSAFIVNDQTVPIGNDNSVINASQSSVEVKLNDTYSSSSGQIEGTIVKAPQLGFIAPRSFAQSRDITLRHSIFQLDDDPGKRSRNPERGYSLRTRYFDRENSPIEFRTYLTLSTRRDLTTTFSFETPFWVDNVATSASGPHVVNNQRYDCFYLSTATGAGVFLASAAVGIVILSASAD